MAKDIADLPVLTNCLLATCQLAKRQLLTNQFDQQYQVNCKCVIQMSYSEKVFDYKMEPNCLCQPIVCQPTDIWLKDSCHHNNFVKS